MNQNIHVYTIKKVEMRKKIHVKSGTQESKEPPSLTIALQQALAYSEPTCQGKWTD